MGLEPERLQIGYCSAAEGQRFQRMAIRIDKEIRELGPSPLRSYAKSNYEKAQARLEKKRKLQARRKSKSKKK